MIHKAINKSRISCNKSLANLASVMKVPENSIKKLESGKKIVGLTAIEAYAKICGISTRMLILFSEQLMYPQKKILPDDAPEWMLRH